MEEWTKNRGMPKYTLSGEITLQYTDWTVSDGSHTRSFDEIYNLNFKSYVINPAIMNYNAYVGVTHSYANVSDSSSSQTDLNYGLQVRFFDYSPLSLSLRATGAQSGDIQQNSYGLTLSYIRDTSPQRTLSMWQRGIAENNSNGNGNGNGNTQASRRGRWYIDILPQSYILDIDRYDYRVGDSNVDRTWYNALLRTRGAYKNTRYYLNFNYYDFVDHKNTDTDTDSHSHSFSANLSTYTDLRWKYFQYLDNNFFYATDGEAQYSASSLLSGAYGYWNYAAQGSYYHSPGALGGDDRWDGSLTISRSELYRYLYKGWQFDFDYGVGVAYLPAADRQDYYVRGGSHAYKLLGPGTTVDALATIQLGTAGSFYEFRPSIRHVRPLLSWLTLSAQYTLGVSGASGDRGVDSTQTGTAGWLNTTFQAQGKTLVTHNASLAIDGKLRDFTLSSVANYWYSARGNTKGTSFLSWVNSVTYQRKIWRVVYWNIGAYHSLDWVDVNFNTDSNNWNTSNTYRLYTSLSYSPWRNATLSAAASVSRTTPDDITSYSLSSSLAWLWRSLWFSVSGAYDKEKRDGGSDVDRWRLDLRVTRPFNIVKY